MEWEHFFGYHGKIKLLKRYNFHLDKYEFKVERKLLNMPKVNVISLDKNNMNKQEEILKELGYDYYFEIELESEKESVDGLNKIAMHYLETVEALNLFKMETSRVLDVWIH